MAGGYPEVYRATSVDDAVRELAELGDKGAPLAGCTWIMRSPARREGMKARYVSLQDLDELRTIEPGDPVTIGARATHADLEPLDPGNGALGALARAAGLSANRSVRNVATLGGNLGARGFAASDLIPALLASDAQIEVVTTQGVGAIPIAEYMAAQDTRPVDELIVRVSIPAPPSRRSWYERLTVRGSSEYPIVGVAVSVDLDEAGEIATARVGIGSVDVVARRSTAAEAALRGQAPTAAVGEEAGRAAAAELDARDDVDAPGWYRLAVLPALTRDAVARLGD